jgi:adenylate cyclase
MTLPAMPVSAPQVDTDIHAIADWLIAQALGSPALDALFDGTCHRVAAAGIPVLRAHMSFTILHPLHRAMGFTWRRNTALEVESYAYDPGGPPPRWRQSPQFHMLHHRLSTLRRRLTGPDALLDFDLMRDLADQGATDFYAFVQPFGEAGLGPDMMFEGDGIYVSWTTDRPSGFSEREIAALSRLHLPIAVASRMAIQGQIAQNVVATYLGRDAGQRVLSGKIRRGEGETISAAIWYSDLRDSTAMAEKLDRSTYTSVLNCYFECMGEAVTEAGGEILGFMGDAVMAIFPVRDGGLSAMEACRRALAAAHDAQRRLTITNSAREGAGLPVLKYGLALHLGNVMFGNIGTRDRLAFSVIGSSVNEVARLQDKTKELGAPLLASGTFAAALPGHWRDLGQHALRGVGAPMTIHAPSG